MTLTLRYAARSDRGLIRDGNQDSVYAGPRLLAVADGMGGMAAGDVASNIVIATMAECAAVCEHAHLPLQSGSTRVLKVMRRTYSRERYLALVAKLRGAIPDLALTSGPVVVVQNRDSPTPLVLHRATVSPGNNSPASTAATPPSQIFNARPGTVSGIPERSTVISSGFCMR